jgi:hypothetical protein
MEWATTLASGKSIPFNSTESLKMKMTSVAALIGWLEREVVVGFLFFSL